MSASCWRHVNVTESWLSWSLTSREVDFVDLEMPFCVSLDDAEGREDYMFSVKCLYFIACMYVLPTSINEAGCPYNWRPSDYLMRRKYNIQICYWPWSLQSSWVVTIIPDATYHISLRNQIDTLSHSLSKTSYNLNIITDHSVTKEDLSQYNCTKKMIHCNYPMLWDENNILICDISTIFSKVQYSEYRPWQQYIPKGKASLCTVSKMVHATKAPELKIQIMAVLFVGKAIQI